MKQDTLAGELEACSNAAQYFMAGCEFFLVHRELRDRILAALRTDGEANSRAVPSGEAVERDAVIAFLRFQDERGVTLALENDKGTARRAAFGGGALALSRAADAIEAGEHLEFAVTCIGCGKPIGSKSYAVDVNGETACPATFTEDGSGECWNPAALSASKPEDASALLKEARTVLSVILDVAADFTETDRANCAHAAALISRIDASIGRDGA